jgi:hypothetical protein
VGISRGFLFVFFAKSKACLFTHHIVLDDCQDCTAASPQASSTRTNPRLRGGVR